MSTPATGPQPSKYLRPIRRGEYDIATISLIGFDPNDSRPYEDCHREWQEALETVQTDGRAARWWQLRRRMRNRLRTAALSTHLGMS